MSVCVSGSATTDWEGERYDRVSAPQEEWAKAVLERLPLEGGETVLDAGCGSGRVTRRLLERLPNGRVIGVDGSPSMIETAAGAFAGSGRVTLFVSDLLALEPDLLESEAGAREVDAIFSNATFHWIRDHAALFSALRSVLRPGGRLVAQCGGRGNVAQWVAAIEVASQQPPFDAHLRGFRPWNFYGPEETAERLRTAGFERISCEIVEVEPVRPEDPREFLSVVGLAAHNARLPEDLREPFAETVVASLPRPVELIYKRLNIEATAAPAS